MIKQEKENECVVNKIFVFGSIHVLYSVIVVLRSGMVVMVQRTIKATECVCVC